MPATESCLPRYLYCLSSLLTKSPVLFRVEMCCLKGLHFPGSLADRYGHVTKYQPVKRKQKCDDSFWETFLKGAWHGSFTFLYVSPLLLNSCLKRGCESSSCDLGP